ncbi:MAG: ABC transporter permease [Chloroflexota bacterium]
MSAPAARPPVADGRPALNWLGVLQSQPVVPLVGLLLVLVILLQLVRPGIVSPSWISTTILFATPLAILAAAQTLVMLTGGIDLSVASVASMAAYVTATQSSRQGDLVAILLGLGAALLVGLANGIGVGIFAVHPLIMTLGMGLVVVGFLTVYQVLAIASAAAVPAPLAMLFSGTAFGFFPNSLFFFLPLAALILFALRRTGYGRLLYAIGDNPTAARLSGVRAWQVLLVVYVISGFLAGLAGLALSGVAQSATIALADVYLLPSVAAVVIGGTSIYGGRGGYGGSIVGALILTVLVTLLTVLEAPQPVRQILYGVIILAVAAAYARASGEGNG